MVKKIMVVDDDPGVIYTVKHGIEGLDPDYEITAVKSGRECLDLLKNKEIPDLILLDIMMPEMSGWETYQKIKEEDDWKNIPIVFLTARTDNIAKDAGGFLGDDYIEKPFKVPELKERIDKILKR
jgi:CheY-like chemotaxis protein